jgi:hypothetical protein
MDNIILTTDLNLETLNSFPHSKLNEFSTLLVDAIRDLKLLIDSAVENGDIDKVIQYKEYLNYSISNKNKVDACLINKENKLKVETEFSTIFLN